MAVVAKVDIDEGEEVLINYMDDGQDDDESGHQLGVERRREQLMQQYHFHCVCSLCLEQEKAI